MTRCVAGTDELPKRKSVAIIIFRYRPSSVFRSATISVVHSRHIIAVFELAVLRIKAPAAGVPALGDDYTLGGRLWDLDLGGDGVGLVFDVKDAVLRQASHAGDK